ncbi:hypothetical protein EM6_3363 (plasmid) [Asticcacaulis excentricus]|uniref:Uncharacterized protein n=1 Tax=Asticcacaulis excentricus TaxID=78587 RepID=A0A3G9G661_9CAUL|nr:hypothetical protein EM6_3363 [Asticcacaulis excentricus]
MGGVKGSLVHGKVSGNRVSGTTVSGPAPDFYLTNSMYHFMMAQSIYRDE